MPKYSPNQSTSYTVLSDTLATVRNVAATSTDADKALLAIANDAAKYASNWVRCNVENNGRGEMRAHARALAERALTDSHTPVSFAFMALGYAFQRFADCDYRRANEYALQAEKLATMPLVKFNQVMAKV